VVLGMELLDQGAQDLRQQAGARLTGSTGARGERGQSHLIAGHAFTPFRFGYRGDCTAARPIVP
jgi:hypothetical protein